jgi:hypothetical protein
MALTAFSGIRIKHRALPKAMAGSAEIKVEKPTLGRHKRTCSVCRHTKCEEIETDFIAWRSPAAITN